MTKTENFDDVAKVMETQGKHTDTQTHITRANSLDIVKDQFGLTKETMQKVADAERALVGGAIQVCRDHLAPRIKTAVAEGTPLDTVKYKTILPSYSGQTEVTLFAHKSARHPKTGEVTHSPRIRVKRYVTTGVPGEVAKDAEKFIRDLIGEDK